MKTLYTISLLGLLAFNAIGQIESVLDEKLSAIVTVAIYESGDHDRVFGFGESADVPIAYKGILDLAEAQSSGSGFVLSYNLKKYVVTNAHVINSAAEGDNSIVCYSINRTKYRMRVVGGDSFYDLAILEFIDKPGPELKTMSFRTEPLKVGTQVYSLGNPLGKYPYSVTDGIVSAKNRTLQGLTAKYGYLQHTATVIWGNSGGPLMDTEGNVAGINTRIEITEQGFSRYIQPQINFALEHKLAQELIIELLENEGRLIRSYFGVVFAQNNSYSFFDEDGDEKPYLQNVIKGSPGEAKLKPLIGSRLVSVNGNKTGNLQEALGVMEQIEPGETVKFEFDKDGTTSEVSFITKELTSEMLGSLAESFFENFFEVKMKETADGILATRMESSAKASKKEEKEDSGFEELWEETKGAYEGYSKEELDSVKTFFKELYTSFSSIFGDDDLYYNSSDDFFDEDETLIAAVGTVDEYGMGGTYGVKSLENLGAALRIATITGKLKFFKKSYFSSYYFDDDVVDIMDSGNTVKILLY
ncbi:MAG: trypsin-like peptidase domain-containing protein [Flavobacteriales bacterium]|nr:trypsin-like peptidase domain-containing protein [Flavobacteriales bacterium]